MMRRPEEPKQGIPVPLFNLVYHDCVIIPWMMEKHENEDYMLYALINGGAPYFDRMVLTMEQTVHLEQAATSQKKNKRNVAIR